ncbi:MAG: hypothetical protein MAG551_01333 [Candidatus Scalindua arabica]|uniref:Uncharacterized protein n=1 Tax=Candidatus Scalindua arabica TaxID=1127984 RepID=A0A941W344_9BACT|nr:hypothetical protein [Candidatus Scalindua arabica]
MKLDRRIVKLSQMNDIIDDDYVNASMKDRIEMVWEITSELWSLTKEGESDAKSRLQRDVANLTKPGC